MPCLFWRWKIWRNRGHLLPLLGPQSYPICAAWRSRGRHGRLYVPHHRPPRTPKILLVRQQRAWRGGLCREADQVRAACQGWTHTSDLSCRNRVQWKSIFKLLNDVLKCLMGANIKDRHEKGRSYPTWWRRANLIGVQLFWLPKTSDHVGVVPKWAGSGKQVSTSDKPYTIEHATKDFAGKWVCQGRNPSTNAEAARKIVVEVRRKPEITDESLTSQPATAKSGDSKAKPMIICRFFYHFSTEVFYSLKWQRVVIDEQSGAENIEALPGLQVSGMVFFRLLSILIINV